MCRTSAGFYVYVGRRYENNDIFQKCVQIRLDVCCCESPQAKGRSVGPYAVGLYQPAGWLAAAAAKSSCSGPTGATACPILTSSKTH